MGTSLDEDLTVLENLDFDPMCNAGKSCGAKADWSVEKTCCGRHFYFCNPCREYNQKMNERSREFRCTDCGATGSSIKMFFTNWVRL